MGLSGDNGLRITHNGVFPLRGGYRARRPTHSRQLSVFPLRAGVIGAHNVVRGYVKSVSPVWGLSGNNGLRITHNGVCPLRAGVIGSCLASRLFPPCVSPAWGLSACPQSGVSSPLVFPRLTGVIWGMWLSTERTESSFPCAGLSVPQFLTD